MMKIKIKMIANLLQLLPEGTIGGVVEVEMDDGTTVTEAISPYGVPLDDSCVIVVNGRSVPLDSILSDGDTITAFSAIAGG